MRICTSEHPLKLAVLISGNGSNLQAVIDAIADGLPAEICVVISDQAEAYGITRAKRAEIPVELLLDTDFKDRDSYDEALGRCLAAHKPDLILLAGFMRILTPRLVAQFKNHIVNIHPSLLPKYPGLNTHTQVLKAKDEQHGATVHVVTETLDNGPIIIQSAILVSPEDDVLSLKHKVHMLEHKLYPEVIRLYAQGMLELRDDEVLLDGEKLPPGGLEFRVHY